MGLVVVYDTKKEANISRKKHIEDFKKRGIKGRRIVIKRVPISRLRKMIRPNYWKKMSKEEKKQYGLYFFNKKRSKR